MFVLPKKGAVARNASLKEQSRKGFALVLCLALLSVVFALVVGMTSLVTVELRRTQLRQETVMSRTYARFGLGVVLGELKKHVGPDQRVTAAASLLQEDEESSSGRDGRRHWTGVWDANDKDAQPVWLVSERNADPSESDSYSMNMVERVELVGELGNEFAAEDKVRVGKVGVELVVKPSLRSNRRGSRHGRKTSGSYAYWVGDEGLKAKINMPRGEDALNSTGFGVSVIPGFETFESQVPAQTRSKLLNEASVADATGAVSKKDLNARFHDVTVHGHGVLANVKGGGLRRDLTAGLQLDAKDSEGELVLTGDEQIFGSVGGGESPSQSGGGGFVPGRGFPELQGYELWNN
ncbi:uncharacterized protein METZ01_LOCUS322131, partial [marine metagenome]